MSHNDKSYYISLPLPDAGAQSAANGAAWTAALTAIDHAARPVLDRLVGRSDGRAARWERLMCGCHVSLPGALDQNWHADGDGRLRHLLQQRGA